MIEAKVGRFTIIGGPSRHNNKHSIQLEFDRGPVVEVISVMSTSDKKRHDRVFERLANESEKNIADIFTIIQEDQEWEDGYSNREKGDIRYEWYYEAKYWEV